MGDTGDYEKDDDVSSRTQRFSLNMGAGLQYMVTSTLVLSVEAKYALMKHSSTDLFSFSIGYHF
ncbi:MAG: porin family protein, partial [Muribaculaceae bacterium]|nr:porin family protein [Muribaculaceae bacterium]